MQNAGLVTPIPVLSIRDFHSKIKDWAWNQPLVAAAEAALGIPISNSAWQDLLKALQTGDFSLAPDVALLDDAALGGAQGAFSKQGLIALNATWAAQASEQELEAVFTEEFGHWLDARFNSSDSPGDEGARFAEALLGLEATDLAGSDNDAIRIRLNNTWVNAEASSQATRLTTAWIAPMVLMPSLAMAVATR